MEVKPLEKPYTEEEIREMLVKDPDAEIKGVVEVPIYDMIELNIDSCDFQIWMMELLVGDSQMINGAINYTLVGYSPEHQSIYLEIRGEVSMT
jgi:hypothetical protein